MNDRLDAAPPVLVGCADRTDQAFTRTGQLSLPLVSCGGAGVSLATVAACAASMTSAPPDFSRRRRQLELLPRLSCGQAISGTRRCASANSKSHSSSTAAATSWLPVPLSLSNWSLFRSSLQCCRRSPRPRHDRTLGRAAGWHCKILELLECGQDNRLVEIDASVDLIGADLDPGGSHTGTVIRPVVTVQDSDLPFLDVCAATKCLRGTVTNRPNRLRARAHRLLGLPGAGSNTAPDDRSTNRDKPVYPSKRSSAGITVSRTWAMPASMDEDCARKVVLRAYTICLLCVGSVSTAPPSLHRPPTGKARQ